MKNLSVYKKNEDYSYTIGVFPTIELLQTRPETVLRVIISERGKANKGIDKIRAICGLKKIQMVTSHQTISKLSRSDNNYALAYFKKYYPELEENKNHLVLVSPWDMGNLGTIIRTSVAFGINDIAIIKPGVDIFDPKVIRGSMGSLFKINFKYFDFFETYFKNYKTKRNIYSFVLQNGTNINSIKFANPLSLVFGNEGAGLNKDYEKYGNLVYIPQTNMVDSMNLSVAVGIGLFKATN